MAVISRFLSRLTSPLEVVTHNPPRSSSSVLKIILPGSPLAIVYRVNRSRPGLIRQSSPPAGPGIEIIDAEISSYPDRSFVILRQAVDRKTRGKITGKFEKIF